MLLDVQNVSMHRLLITGVKEQMEPLTTEQEKSLSSDDKQTQVEEEKNGDKVGTLESDIEESKTGTSGNLSLYNENSEASETRTSDDADMRESSTGGDGSILEAAQEESDVSDNLVSSEATEKPPVSDIAGDSLAPLSSQSNNGSIASEKPSETVVEADAKILEPFVVDTSSENLFTDHPNGGSSLKALEKPNLSLNPSSADPSILNISVRAESETVGESNIIQEEVWDSGSALSTRDDVQTEELLTMDVGPSNILEVSADGDDKSALGKSLNGTVSTGEYSLPEVAYQPVNEHLENDYPDINVTRSFFESTNPRNFFTSAGIPAPSVVSAALQAPPGKVLVPAAIDQLQIQALSALQVLKVS